MCEQAKIQQGCDISLINSQNINLSFLFVPLSNQNALHDPLTQNSHQELVYEYHKNQSQLKNARRNIFDLALTLDNDQDDR